MIAFLPDTDFVAPDLRGRGGSRELPGPSSIGQHAEDLLQLADALDSEKVIVAGHSMGGFVAVAFAAAHPERAAGVVLVDGGVTIPPAEGETEGGGGAAVVSDLQLVLARLGQTYRTREEYRELWRAHPATGPYWNDAIAHYVDTDLVGAEPELQAGSRAERIQEDMVDMLSSAGGPEPLDSLAAPAIVLRAERGLLDQPEGLYPRGALQQIAVRHPLLEVREIEDVNHYTILLEDRAAREVAQAIHDVTKRTQA